MAGGASKVSSVPSSIPINAPYMSPCFMSSPSPHTSSSGGRTPNASGSGEVKAPFSTLNNIRRDANLMGQTIRISQGPYKGYFGIVKDATESTYKIELHAKCQTITVDRNRIVPTKYVCFLY